MKRVSNAFYGFKDQSNFSFHMDNSLNFSQIFTSLPNSLYIFLNYIIHYCFVRYNKNCQLIDWLNFDRFFSKHCLDKILTSLLRSDFYLQL